MVYYPFKLFRNILRLAKAQQPKSRSGGVGQTRDNWQGTSRTTAESYLAVDRNLPANELEQINSRQILHPAATAPKMLSTGWYTTVLLLLFCTTTTQCIQIFRSWVGNRC